MAFKDITKVLYEGKYKLDYKDKAHRYYVRERVDFNLPEEDPKAWGKIQYPKGTTTLLGDTLEKKGLMTWPLGLAIRELTGYYDFVNDEGEQMTGFSKGIGSLWDGDNLISGTKEEIAPLIKSANEAWKRKQKKGADIGSIVHDAIEHYILKKPFDIEEQYNWAIKEAFPLPLPSEEDQFEAERNKAADEAPLDVEMATKAFLQFEKWWLTVQPTLYGAEEILLSVAQRPFVVGTYDADLGIKTEFHPIFSKAREDVDEKFHAIYDKVHESGEVRATTDWKTSNAAKSKDAAAPEGIYYSYFIQDAIYEKLRREMGFAPADDLLAVSARKDGGFGPIWASELGLTVDECLEWAEAVILCNRLMDQSKKALNLHGEAVLNQVNPTKEAF